MNSSPTILVYDDEDSILEVLEIILNEAGYHVITSTHAETILADIEKFQPSLLLIDIWMKEVNGYDLVKKIKLNDSTKHIPAVLISALNEGEEIAQKAGADGFLKKPFDMNELTEFIELKIKKK